MRGCEREATPPPTPPQIEERFGEGREERGIWQVSIHACGDGGDAMGRHAGLPLRAFQSTPAGAGAKYDPGNQER